MSSFVFATTPYFATSYTFASGDKEQAANRPDNNTQFKILLSIINHNFDEPVTINDRSIYNVIGSISIKILLTHFLKLHSACHQPLRHTILPFPGQLQTTYQIQRNHKNKHIVGNKNSNESGFLFFAAENRILPKITASNSELK